jgi:hypothetical protein
MQPCCHRVVDGTNSMSVAFKPIHTNIHWILPWGIETLVVLREKRASRLVDWLVSVDTHNNGCKTLHPSLLQFMTFPTRNFDQKVPVLVTVKTTTLVIFVKSFLTWLIWLWPFWLIEWWIIWLVRSTSKIFG